MLDDCRRNPYPRQTILYGVMVRNPRSEGQRPQRKRTAKALVGVVLMLTTAVALPAAPVAADHRCDILWQPSSCAAGYVDDLSDSIQTATTGAAGGSQTCRERVDHTFFVGPSAASGDFVVNTEALARVCFTRSGGGCSVNTLARVKGPIPTDVVWYEWSVEVRFERNDGSVSTYEDGRFFDPGPVFELENPGAALAEGESAVADAFIEAHWPNGTLWEKNHAKVGFMC